MICGRCSEMIPDDSQFCPFCGYQQKRTLYNNRKNQNKEAAIGLVFITVIAIIFIYYFFTISTTTKKQYEKLAQLYNMQQEEAEKLQAFAKKYNDIENYLTLHSNSLFTASDYVFTMTPGSTTDFQLMTSFFEGVRVSYSQYGDSASLEFLEDSWSGITTLKIYAGQEGVTWFRFYNDSNDKSFCIIVIVAG